MLWTWSALQHFKWILETLRISQDIGYVRMVDSKDFMIWASWLYDINRQKPQVCRLTVSLCLIF